MPRYVLLRHECPASMCKPTHWDLMLEHNGALLTWSLAYHPPSKGEPNRAQGGSSCEATRRGIEIPATQLPNHRLDYLTYEGPVSNNRGQVTRIDAGAYDLIEQSPTRLACTLHGELLNGKITLTRITSTDWQFTLY